MNKAIDGNALGWRKPWDDLEPAVQAAIISGDEQRARRVQKAYGHGAYWRGYGPGHERAECLAWRNINGEVVS
jgi:hypothetical protein